MPTNTPPALFAAKERTALCTVLSDDFIPGFAVLVHSFKTNHPGFAPPFVIVHNDKLATLSAVSRELVKRLYPNVRFIEADDSSYETVWSNRDGQLKTPERLKSAFFILEAFNLTEFDRVVTLDSDMICLGDLTPLFEQHAPLSATFGTNYKTGLALDYFNTGVLVIGKQLLTGETYRALLNHRISKDYDVRKGKADQAILNDYFPSGSVSRLDEKLNITKRKYPDAAVDRVEDLYADDVRILHFVGEKPWQSHRSDTESSYTKLETFWASILREALSFEDMLTHLRLQQLKLALNQERQAKIAELKRYAGATDLVVTKLFNDLDGIRPKAKGSIWNKFFGILRLDKKGVLHREIARARKRWSQHHMKLERKLTGI
jgi:lipopolysaccharide biosynthesis glycosyltransferase